MKERKIELKSKESLEKKGTEKKRVIRKGKGKKVEMKQRGKRGKR